MNRLMVPAAAAGFALALAAAPAAYAQDHAPDHGPEHPAGGEHPARPALPHQVAHKRVVVQKHVDEHVTKHVTEHVAGHADGRVVERGVPVGRGRWHSGDHFAGNRVVFRDYDRYHVRRPPAGYEWVEDNGELVLISLDTGLISDIFVIPIP